MNEPLVSNKSPWIKAPVANLVRYEPSGVYFARAKVGGKLIRKSLETDVLSIAKLRLSDLLKSEHQRLTRQKAVKVGKMTFGDALEIFKQRVEKESEIKPGTKKYQREIIQALQKSWPALVSLDVKRITNAVCSNWRTDFAAKYSPTRVNGAISVLRRVFAVAVEAGVLSENPVREIRRARVKSKELTLPEPEQFLEFVKELARGGGRDSKHCADFVCFMAYGGFRKTEAANITWGDCDFNKSKIIVRGDPETGTKNGEVREVPMIPDMQTLLGRLRLERSSISAREPVMMVRECQKSMDRAAKVVGMHRITHHDLRHLFATRCIESGVDIPTVSRWLGHKDGGALAMKVYGHLRDQHSTEMAQKVSFAKAIDIAG